MSREFDDAQQSASQPGDAVPIGLARKEFEARFGAIEDLDLMSEGPARTILNLCLQEARSEVARAWSQASLIRTASLWDTLGRDPEPLPYVNYVDGFASSRKFGATADRGPSVELIGIYPAMPCVFQEVFASMLSKPDILRSIGSPRMEIDSAQRLNIPRYVREAINPSRPRDPVRASCAVELAVLASTFVVVHEVAHHMFGHLAYWKSRGAPVGGRAEEYVDRERHVMEIDADCFAAYRMLFGALNRDLADPSTTISSRGDASHVFKMAFAINVAYFWGIQSAHYPSPRLRQSLIAMILPSMRCIWLEVTDDRDGECCHAGD